MQYPNVVTFSIRKGKKFVRTNARRIAQEKACAKRAARHKIRKVVRGFVYMPEEFENEVFDIRLYTDYDIC